MIALDPNHNTDPDYPVEPEDTKMFSKDAPVWCIWEDRGKGDDFHREPVQPFGRTYWQLLWGDDAKE